MNKKAFWDTCLVIAFVFHINSLHYRSYDVFNSYDQHFWSNFVKKEYQRRYAEKFKNLLTFFNELNIELESPSKEFYTPFDLIQFAMKKYSDKLQDDAKNSVEPFWSEYIGIQSQVSFHNLKNNVDSCLTDLYIDTASNDNIIRNNLQLTPKRTNDYTNINMLLESQGVTKEDRHVALDAYDFALKSSDPIDFITFDKVLYSGANNSKMTCFNSIKGKKDFKAS